MPLDYATDVQPHILHQQRNVSPHLSGPDWPAVP